MALNINKIYCDVIFPFWYGAKLNLHVMIDMSESVHILSLIAAGRDESDERPACEGDPRGQWEDPKRSGCSQSGTAGYLAGDEPWVRV